MIPVKTQFTSNYNIKYLISIIKEKYATWKALARKQDKLSQSQLDAINSLSSSGTFDASKIPNLDASKITTGTIDIDRLPQGALERLVTVANQTARFALTSTDVQLGDTVKQTDTGVMYIVTDTANLANDNGYTEYTAGSATSVPWSGVTGKPTFANVATSGSYNDLSDKPTIPTVPTNYVTTDTTQTVSGQKTWTDIQTYNEMVVYSHSSDVVEQSRQKLPKDVSTSTDPMARFSTLVDSAGHNVVVTTEGHWETYASKSVSLKYKNDSTKAGTVDFRLGSNGKGIFYPQSPFECSLGNSTNQWASVYARAYYYNGTEFQSKFVTVDTNQTITGNKTFTGATVTHNVIPETGATYTLGDPDKWYMDTYTNTVWVQGVRAPGTSNALILAAMETWEDGARIFMYGKDHAEGCHIYADIDHNDGNHNKTGVILDTNGFFPAGVSRHLGLANANNRWLTFNGINPGKLSLPQYGAGRIDISSAITDRAWNVNLYTPPVDGWLAVLVSGRCIIQQNGTYGPSAGSFDTTDVFDLRVFCPVAAGATYEIFVRGTVNEASLYPCFGNV